MKLIPLAKISRPHGYKGGVVAATSSGMESGLGDVDQVLIGTSEQVALPYRILEASWMPKGWKLVLETVTSEEQANDLRGAIIYCRRDQLPEPAPNEFYVVDLIGCQVIDSATNLSIGTLTSVDFDGQQRWSIQNEFGERVIPATKHFIGRVDIANRIVYLKNLSDLP